MLSRLGMFCQACPCIYFLISWEQIPVDINVYINWIWRQQTSLFKLLHLFFYITHVQKLIVLHELLSASCVLVERRWLYSATTCTSAVDRSTREYSLTRNKYSYRITENPFTRITSSRTRALWNKYVDLHESLGWKSIFKICTYIERGQKHYYFVGDLETF